jgi:hypothetical protein
VPSVQRVPEASGQIEKLGALVRLILLSPVDRSTVTCFASAPVVHTQTMKVAVWPGRTLAADLPKGWTDTQSCAVPGVGLGDGVGDFVGVGLFVGVGDLVGVGLLVGVGDLVGLGLLLVGDGADGDVEAGPDADGPDGVESVGVAATVPALLLGEGEVDVTKRDEPGEF